MTLFTSIHSRTREAEAAFITFEAIVEDLGNFSQDELIQAAHRTTVPLIAIAIEAFSAALILVPPENREEFATMMQKLIIERLEKHKESFHAPAR